MKENIMKKLNVNTIDNFFTHNSKFHADEICSAAELNLAVPSDCKIKFLRVNDKELTEKATLSSFIFDIGGGYYDHHFRDQPELKKFYPEDYSQVKGEPIEKAACARIWEDFGESIVSNVLHDRYPDPKEELFASIAESVDREFISKISDTDTKGQVARPNEFSAIVTRRWDVAANRSKEFQDEIFEILVRFFQDELYCRIVTIYDKLIKEIAVQQLAEKADKDHHPTWINLTENWSGDYIQAHLFAKTAICYTITKSDRVEGQWNLQSVDCKKYSLEACSTYPGFIKNPIAPLVIFDSKENAERAATFLSM